MATEDAAARVRAELRQRLHGELRPELVAELCEEELCQEAERAERERPALPPAKQEAELVASPPAEREGEAELVHVAPEPEPLREDAGWATSSGPRPCPDPSRVASRLD